MSGASSKIEVLYDAHCDAIHRYVMRRVGRPEIAEELTAQTFYKALRSWRRFVDDRPRAWLYRIATNEINDHFRRSARTAPEPEPSSGPEAADRSLERHRLYDTLRGVLCELPPDDQTLIALRYFEQLSFPEIARIVGRRKGTAVMRTHRALKKLRERLQQRGIDHDSIRGILDADAAARPAGSRFQAQAAR